MITKKFLNTFLFKIKIMLRKLWSRPKYEKTKITALCCKTRFENKLAPKSPRF